jgi:Ca-activated chloride channel family protein
MDAAGAVDEGRSVQTPVFTGRAELTVLNVVVTNRSGGFVAGLPREAFTVSEGGRVQPVALFSSVDAPATVALLVDGSGSMHAMRDLIAAAGGAFAATSNPQDEIAALTFTERVHPVLPAGLAFTSDPRLLEGALQTAMRGHGRTALHDAVKTALIYVGRGRHLRKVLIVVSDGGDNASGATFEEVAHAATTSNTVIYAIAVLDRLGGEGDPKRLKALAELTGGTAQAPRTPGDVRSAFERVARDIRSAYLVGYVPPPTGAAVRRIDLAVRGPGGERLHARTRREYVRREE